MFSHWLRWNVYMTKFNSLDILDWLDATLPRLKKQIKAGQPDPWEMAAE